MFSRLFTSFLIGRGMASISCSLRAESLGDVHFPTSCKPGTQGTFDSSVALLHSFEFREAEAAFTKWRKKMQNVSSRQGG